MQVPRLNQWMALLLLVALVQCGGGPAASAIRALPPSSGLEVYVYTDLATDLAARQAFFTFAKARNVRRAYMQSAGLLGTSRGAFCDFVADAKGHGMAVTLLFGRAEWALTANHASAIQYASQSLAFQAELQAAGRPAPDAIQFDVEPYLLPEWTTDMEGTANQYLDLFGALKTQLNGRLLLVAAIPFWFDARLVSRNGRTRPLSEWIIDATDGTVMMDYRDTAQAIMDCAASELAYASSQGKPMILALDVEQGSDPIITFFEEGEAALFQAMAAVESGFRAQAAFKGFGVFSYEDWRLLNP